ncbi:MAG: Gfo/Idh/MocA family oxidoreductase, partial [Ilumatobacteraceae bacterium]
MSAGLMPLRYAVVGAGMMGVEHIHALKSLPATEVVALCDPHAPSIASALAAVSWSRDRTTANNTPQPRVYDDVESLVADGGFDVAVVATPN